MDKDGWICYGMFKTDRYDLYNVNIKIDRQIDEIRIF